MSLDQLMAWIPPGSADLELARQIQPDRLPQHVAIIMDGNGRWAASATRRAWRGTARIQSARVPRPGAAGAEGAHPLRSVENWKRPAAEVGTLMSSSATCVKPRRCSRTTSASM
jgi:undecaprenyl diphosphate synthase